MREQPRRAKTVVVFVDFDVSRDPKACRVGQKLIGLRQFEKARPAEWKVHVAHRLERHAHEQFQRCPVWLDERLQGDVGRNIVGLKDARKSQPDGERTSEPTHQ